MQIKIVKDQLFESNCYVIEENKRCVVIDPNNGEEIAKILKENNWDLDYIILTHEHYDHVSGLPVLQKENPLSKTVASELCKEGLEHVVDNIERSFKVYLHFLKKPIENYPTVFQYRIPDITFSKTNTFEWQGHVVSLRAIPGHSKGSIFIEFDKKIVFSGDSLLREREVVTKFLGGDLLEFKKNVLPILLGLPGDRVVYPGHGEIFSLCERKEKYYEQRGND